VALPAGITVQGGWVYTGGGTWSRPCALDAAQVVIAAPPGEDRTVIAAFDGTTTLEALTVVNETTAAPGTSTTPGPGRPPGGATAVVAAARRGRPRPRRPSALPAAGRAAIPATGGTRPPGAPAGQATGPGR